MRTKIYMELKGVELGFGVISMCQPYISSVTFDNRIALEGTLPLTIYVLEPCE